MIAIYHAIPLAHVVAMSAQFWINSLQNRGYNKNKCLFVGNVVHEAVEILVNILFGRIDRLIYGSSDLGVKDEGIFGDLTFYKFLAKAASSFSSTYIVDQALPKETLKSLGMSESRAHGTHLVISGLAGVIGTEIPEWLEAYQLDDIFS
jgi:hypothetical protein